MDYKTIDPEKTKKVLDLFYRPLREGEIQKDNRASTIAKELGFTRAMVDKVITRDLDLKRRNVHIRNGHIKQ